MISAQDLLLRFAEILNDGKIIEDTPYWICEVQMQEGNVSFRVDGDHSDSVWFKLEIDRG